MSYFETKFSIPNKLKKASIKTNMQLNELNKIVEVIAKKEFDKTNLSNTPFLGWNGQTAIDCMEIEKLYLSYNFVAMQDKIVNQIKIDRTKDQIKKFLRYKKQQDQISKVLTSLFGLFIVILVLFSQGIIGDYYFYATITMLYLFSINYPALIRKRVKKYRYIKF